MSYEHCDSHDMDATNGCPVCNLHTHCIEQAIHDFNEGLRAKTDELWEYVKAARKERDEWKAMYRSSDRYALVERVEKAEEEQRKARKECNMAEAKMRDAWARYDALADALGCDPMDSGESRVLRAARARAALAGGTD